jgi:hypothetical protein
MLIEDEFACRVVSDFRHDRLPPVRRNFRLRSFYLCAAFAPKLEGRDTPAMSAFCGSRLPAE